MPKEVTQKMIRDKAMQILTEHFATAEGLLNQAVAIPLTDEIEQEETMEDIATMYASAVLFEMDWMFKMPVSKRLAKFKYSEIGRAFPV